RALRRSARERSAPSPDLRRPRACARAGRGGPSAPRDPRGARGGGARRPTADPAPPHVSAGRPRSKHRVHVAVFAIGGLLLFAADLVGRRDGSPPPARETIVVGPERIARLRAEHARRFGAPPDQAELEALASAEVDDEILAREALARGLDRDDPSIRWRLVQKMRFLDERPGRSDEELVREARRLGL